ncbi:hypothetical protein KL771_24520 [Hyphomicrobiaceae bacterium 22]|uniref:Uncharacterized protein n=2 Tax=Prosthecodimorpha staleyi TaxID=2840188 RepID=A0A947D7R4_9HYPH|nr:hypothetical protein [Prosthecodimorpha staleyi]
MAGDQVARLGLAVAVEKSADCAAIAGFGIAAIPGILGGGKAVHVGGLPKPEGVARRPSVSAQSRPGAKSASRRRAPPGRPPRDLAAPGIYRFAIRPWLRP